MLRDIYRVEPTTFAAAKDRLVDMLKLAPLLDTPLRQLSLGQRMRCEFAAALLHAPAILFLDEPTIGLDAVSKLARARVRQGLESQRGVTVILTTHDMHDIEALAKRVIIIGNGKLLRDSSFDRMRSEVLAETAALRRLRSRPATSPSMAGDDPRARWPLGRVCL